MHLIDQLYKQMPLSKNYRLKLVEILYKMKLGRTVSLDDRIWMSKLTKANLHAHGLAENILCPDFVEDTA